MTIVAGFVLASEWYWRIFEGAPVFAAAEAATCARDFLHPLARAAHGRVAITDIAVDPDGDGVRFSIGAAPIALRCAGLRVDQLVAAINAGLRAAGSELAFSIVESRRYELRGVLAPAADPPRRFPSGTLPP